MASVPVPQPTVVPLDPLSPRQVALSSSSCPDTAVSGVLRRCLPPGTGEIIGQTLVQVKRLLTEKALASDWVGDPSRSCA